MNEATVFVPALGIGLSIAAPVGPIGLLVIERTLRQGFGVGLATGLGAAAADALYGAIGAFGVVGLIHALQAARLPLMWGGSLFLLWLAWRTWQAAGHAAPAAADAGRPVALAKAFGGTVLLTLANPATVLSFVAIFSSFAAVLPAGRGGAAAAWMTAGVFIGSALWWLALSSGVGRLRGRFDARWQRRVNLFSAAVLAGFALWQLVHIQEFF